MMQLPLFTGGFRVKKNVIRATCFLVVFFLLFYSLTLVFSPKWDYYYSPSYTTSFYDQPRNSIDVLFIGSSSYYRGTSPLTIWKNFGFTSYTRASANLPASLMYYYLVESLKTQHPRVVILDVSLIFRDYDVDEFEGALRRAIEPMNLSIEKIQAIKAIVSRSNAQTFSSFLLPLLRYHSRWIELTSQDFQFFGTKKNYFDRGSYLKYEKVPQVVPVDFMKPNQKNADYDDWSYMYFEKTIQLCEEKNIDVMFLTLPRLYWKYEKYNSIQKIANERQITYLDYALPDNFSATGIDVSSDYFDNGHLNVYGAIKVSNYLGAYLKERYGFTDNRLNPDFEQWNTDLLIFEDEFEKEIAKDIKPR